jgi:predicted glutamine amidotransferase
MCRLLYVNSKDEFDTGEYLEKFAGVAQKSKEYQGHGWGCAFLQDGVWKYYKNVKPIWEDSFSGFGTSTRLITHARSAFKDEGIFAGNNMPFFDDEYIFIFNGELRGVKIKEDGRIGAEKIFNYIKRFDKGSGKDALQKGTEIITKKSAYVRAMNIILSDSKASYIHSQFNEDDEYFTMYKKVTDDTIVVCSDPFIGEENWEPIPNNSLTEYKCF